MIANLVIVLVIAVIVGLASVYLYRARKRGVKCIGCPSGCDCGGKCSCGHEGKHG